LKTQTAGNTHIAQGNGKPPNREAGVRLVNNYTAFSTFISMFCKFFL